MAYDKAWLNSIDGGNSDGSNNNKVDDHIINSHQSEMQAIADDLNRIYKEAYDATPFSVGKQYRTRKVKGEDGEYKEEKYAVYVLKGSMFFDWSKDRYTYMMYDLIISNSDIKVDIIADKGSSYLNSGVPYPSKNGFLSDWKGGYTLNSNLVKISTALSIYKPDSGNHTIGGVTLHELLRHIHPFGNIEGSVNTLRKYYQLRKGGEHDGFQNRNNSVKKVSNKDVLLKLKNKR